MKIFVVLAFLAVANAGLLPEDFTDPLGDFLQGNVLNRGLAAVNVDSLVEGFKTQISDDDVLAKSFAKFAAFFQKSFPSNQERELRKSIYKKNAVKIFVHNAEAAAGKHSYSMAVNQFGDMTFEEILAGNPALWPSWNQSLAGEVESVGANSWVQDKYRQGGYVSPVQNQGACGSCVYFAVTGCLESNYALHHRQHAQVLSAQQLIDCSLDPSKGNNGCNGGTFVPTFDYLKGHSLTTNQNYPYQARNGACDRSKGGFAKIRNWHRVHERDENDLLNKVDQKGPVAVAIHVNDNWSRYSRGIFEDACQGGRNHGVLVVGFGYDGPSNKNYWIVKNQWGAGFGEGGYIRMLRERDGCPGGRCRNMCDIVGDAVWVEI